MAVFRVFALVVLVNYGSAVLQHSEQSSQANHLRASAKHPQTQGEPDFSVTQEVLQNDGDASYTITVTVGGQQLQAIPDTGSFDLLVFGSFCKTGCGPVGKLYNQSKSSSFQKGTVSTMHQFGSGDAWSSESYDEVISGAVKAESQVFWQVYSADMPILALGDFQAILGLGPPDSSLKMALEDAAQVEKEVKYLLAAGGVITEAQKKIANNYIQLAEHAKTARSIAADFDLRSYSICLGRASGSPGALVWHDVAPESRPVNMFRTIEMQDDMFWSAKLEYVALGSMRTSSGIEKRTPLGCGQRPCKAIVDSGTSLIVAPREALWQVEDALQKWRALSGNCTDLSTLPNLEFMMGGMPFSLPPSSYVGDLSGDWSLLDPKLQSFLPHLDAQIMSLRTERDRDSQPYDSCVPLIMIMDSAPGEDQQWILGMPFFRQYYTTFTLSPGVTEWRRKAKSMSFALADSHCRPTVDKLLQQGHADEQQRLSIDVSKIRVPHHAMRKRPELPRAEA